MAQLRQGLPVLSYCAKTGALSLPIVAAGRIHYLEQRTAGNQPLVLLQSLRRGPKKSLRKRRPFLDSRLGGNVTRYVIDLENATVVARAVQSVTTLTSAGLPFRIAVFARSSAGRISSGISTYSPWAPKSFAIMSKRV